MSFLDDLSDFGSGLLDDVGEGFGNLVTTATTSDTSKNAGTVQQPQAPVKDNHGNAITRPQGGGMDNKTMFMVGGGVLCVIALLGIGIAASRS
ncbi:hypothetical protein [Vibrio coralliilyticus]|uniref:hypothetical protein n=1 Tax=Vibrio coralliilyticus TaxID=190893 RepID=UPI00148C6E2C|nr:hypothetical protein [Vibrio coralliilyticus]NOI32323.1 hypothetical protein [Vibrio coralliilyticus]NOI51434.1 hypothetical protein [Vibrio coralliilyticus]